METSSDSYLLEAGLAEKSGQATQLFAVLQPSFEHVASSPSAHVSKVWSDFEDLNLDNNNLRGAVFELLIGSILLVHGISPAFRQAEVSFVNNARFDFLAWEKGVRPISISVKTSLRERYKQADLEAWALKSVHKNAENFLVTLSANEISTRKRKIAEGLEYSSLDSMYLATSVEFDSLIEYLMNMDFDYPKDINPMANNYSIKR